MDLRQSVLFSKRIVGIFTAVFTGVIIVSNSVFAQTEAASPQTPDYSVGMRVFKPTSEPEPPVMQGNIAPATGKGMQFVTGTSALDENVLETLNVVIADLQSAASASRASPKTIMGYLTQGTGIVDAELERLATNGDLRQSHLRILGKPMEQLLNIAFSMPASAYALTLKDNTSDIERLGYAVVLAGIATTSAKNTVTPSFAVRYFENAKVPAGKAVAAQLQTEIIQQEKQLKDLLQASYAIKTGNSLQDMNASEDDTTKKPKRTKKNESKDKSAKDSEDEEKGFFGKLF